jgi:long-chain acyl-CoA synthetase
MQPEAPKPTPESTHSATLVSLLASNAREHGEQIALRERDRGIWIQYSWNAFFEQALAFAAAAQARGFHPGTGLLVIGDNRPRLYFGMLGALMLRGVPAPVFPDVAPQELQFYAEHSRARFALAEDQEQVDKLLQLREATGQPEIIIYDDARGLSNYQAPGLIAWDTLIKDGRERLSRSPELARTLVEDVRPEDPAVLLHSSGTTGKPKGIVLQHRRVIAAAERARVEGCFRTGDDLMAYLPMAWVGDFVFTVAAGIALRFHINIPERQDTVLANLREIAPTVYFASPRAWDAMLTHVQVGMAETTGVKRWLYDTFMPLAIAHERRRLNGEPPASWATRAQLALGEWLVFAPLRDHLGLSRAQRPFTAGEAIGEDTFVFFRALGLDLKQFYGQTENCALTAAQRPGEVRLHTVGHPLAGVEIRIAADGEILIRSDSVFDGYLDDPQSTAKTLIDGWLHTGDAGYLEPDGQLVVLGRTSEVVYTAGGERFIPNYVENRLKFSPYVKDAAVLGAGREFLAAMICIDMQAVGHWAEENGVTYTSYADLAGKPAVLDLISTVARHVSTLLPAALAIRRIMLLPKEFDPDDGEVTRTRKLRRNVIEANYAPIIEALYDGRDQIEYTSRITYENGSVGELRRLLALRTLT